MESEGGILVKVFESGQNKFFGFFFCSLTKTKMKSYKKYQIFEVQTTKILIF